MRSISPRRSSNVLEYVTSWARTTRSHATGSARRINRTSSRSCRFSLLRLTAVWPCFGTTIPTLSTPRGDATARASKWTPRSRFPSRTTPSNSDPRVIRRSRGKRWATSGSGVLARKLHDETPPPFLPAPAKHEPTPLGCHPRSKSMLANSPLVPWTIRRLPHHQLLAVIARRLVSKCLKIIPRFNIDQACYALASVDGGAISRVAFSPRCP